MYVPFHTKFTLTWACVDSTTHCHSFVTDMKCTYDWMNCILWKRRLSRQTKTAQHNSNIQLVFFFHSSENVQDHRSYEQGMNTNHPNIHTTQTNRLRVIPNFYLFPSIHVFSEADNPPRSNNNNKKTTTTTTQHCYLTPTHWIVLCAASRILICRGILFTKKNKITKIR